MRQIRRLRLFVGNCLATNREIETYKQIALRSQQASLDLAIAMRLAQMQGIDILDDLDALIVDLHDQLAVLEEHVL